MKVSQQVLLKAGGFHGTRIALAEISDGCQLVRAFASLNRIVGKISVSRRSFINGNQG